MRRPMSWQQNDPKQFQKGLEAQSDRGRRKLEGSQWPEQMEPGDSEHPVNIHMKPAEGHDTFKVRYMDGEGYHRVL